jgi:hypothetical protein
MKPDSEHIIYLYGFARTGILPELEKTGLDGCNPVFLHEHMDIAAVVSRVPSEEFRGPSAESRLNDLSWVGPRAVRHEEVVEEVIRYSPVFPARFGTLFSSMDSVERILKEHHDTILQFLEEVADKEEWSVKGLLDRAKAEAKIFSTLLSRESENLSSLSAGRGYFQKQRLRAGVKKALNDYLKKPSKELLEELSARASDFRERSVLQATAPNGDNDMVVNWAFLVPRDEVNNIRALVDRANKDLESQGLAFQISGPWPPYSFCPALETE